MVIDKPDFEDIRHILEAMADALLDEQQDEVAQFILVSAYFCFYFFCSKKLRGYSAIYQFRQMGSSREPLSTTSTADKHSGS